MVPNLGGGVRLSEIDPELDLIDFSDATPRGAKGVILWMDEIHIAPRENHGNPLFVGIYRGIPIPGFLRWCRISSIHSIAFEGACLLPDIELVWT